MKHDRLLMAIIAGALLGVLFGSFFPEPALRAGFLGELFLNALKMMVLPLIVTSLIVGMTQMGNVRALGSIGLKTFFYYMVTTAIAVVVGMILVNWIRPGAGMHAFSGEVPEMIKGKESFSFADVLLGMIHPNLVQAASELKILPIILASLLFGAALTTLEEKARSTIAVFEVLNEAVMQVVKWIIVFTPLGIFGLIAHRLAQAGGGEAFWHLLWQLGKYAFTVILGLIIHGVFILPAILWLFGGRRPLEYFSHLGKAIVTAFGTSSSSATLPLTMECVTKEAKISNRTASVVLPLGATVNMDGTALYEAVAAIFIAQTYGVVLGPGEQVIIFFTATLAAIGAAGIPEAGLVTMVMVLQAVGLPIEGIGIILAIDWFLDRCRTTVNVWGDAVGAAVIEKWEGK